MYNDDYKGYKRIKSAALLSVNLNYPASCTPVKPPISAVITNVSDHPMTHTEKTPPYDTSD